MKKRYYLLLVICFVMVATLLSGCGDGSYDKAQVESEGKVVETMLGTVVMEHIQGDLYYDGITGIVYLISNTYGGNGVYCPYYGPNGFPYHYDVEKQLFVEINPFENCSECGTTLNSQ